MVIVHNNVGKNTTVFRKLRCWATSTSSTTPTSESTRSAIQPVFSRKGVFEIIDPMTNIREYWDMYYVWIQ